MHRYFIFILLLITLNPRPISNQTSYEPIFDGNSAFEYLEAQCSFGPRPPGSDNLSKCREYITDQIESSGWVVELQNFTYRDTKCVNIIAKSQNPNQSRFVLGAHYDTRPLADQDPAIENRTLPVLGANDGASGVAVLLELANSLPEKTRSIVEFVFFDAEDSGEINGWDWIVGSSKYVDLLSEQERTAIRGMILADMVGDESLRIPRERFSTDSLQNRIWEKADTLGYSDVFLDTAGGSIIDDHRPFIDAGIPAVDLIHYPFPWYWHTREDTPDKCSGDSLEAVGSVLESFLHEQQTGITSFLPEPPIQVEWLVVIVVPVIAAMTIILYRRR
ncbi:M28 family peptidase [Candidatus Thorarchaeota archaeon]|nr:MAG: M28 family peptidase [Candidatus Thorarchaeota archaeon]